MKCILLFNASDKLVKAFALTNINVLEMNEDDKHQQLGYLLKKDNYLHLSSKEKTFSEPMVIFNELSDSELDNCLALIRSSGVPVHHKAIVTKYNIDWIVNNLFKELEKERQAFLKK